MRPLGVEGSFLLSLAERVELRLVVLVRSHAAARASVWITEAGDDAEIAQLEVLGRRWLRSIDLTTSEPAADLDLGLPAETVSVAPVPGDHGDVLAVLVAVKQDGRTWSGAERDLLRFAAEHYRADARRLARAPAAAPGHGPRSHGHRAGAAVRTPLAVTPREGELVLDYQPEIDLVTGRVLGAEALVRWDSPQHGLVGPGASSSAPPSRAGSSRPSAPGSSTARSATSRAGWPAGAAADLVLRINVSPLQIAGRPGRRPLPARPGEQYGVAGHPGLRRDHREPARRRHRAAHRDPRASSRRSGCTRRSTTSPPATARWAGCAACPVDTVKLDRALVTGIDTDERGRLIVAAVLRLCAELGVEVVAEGIETPGELATLVELGCRRGPGSPARPARCRRRTLEQLLRRGSTGQFAAERPELTRTATCCTHRLPGLVLRATRPADPSPRAHRTGLTSSSRAGVTGRASASVIAAR